MGPGPGAARGAAGGPPAGADLFAEAIAEHVLARRARAWLAAHPPGSARERAALAGALPLPAAGGPGPPGPAGES